MGFDISSVPRGIRGLIIASIAIWIIQLLPGIGSAVTLWGGLVPGLAFGHGQLWRFLTYMFLHDPSGPFHILFNMLTLWMFGVEIEEQWGTRRFVVFYLIAGVCSGLFSVVAIAIPGLWFTNVIGASGAVLALLTVYALYFPRRQILLFFLVPVNVVVAVAIFGAISLFGAANSWGNISHMTHLGGIIVGFLYVKGFPGINNFLETAKKKLESARRNVAESGKNAGKEYLDGVIDSLLKKISEHGLESLTPDEKRTLEDAAKRRKKGSDGGGPGRILPFK